MSTDTLTLQAGATHVKHDAGLAPVVIRLDKASEYRQWLMFHRVNRDQYNGRGWLPLTDLYTTSARFGVRLTRRQIDNLLTSGNGIFWKRKANRLRLRGYDETVATLLKLDYAARGDMDGLADYRPTEPVWIDAAGKLLMFKAQMYTAFIETRQKSGSYHASRPLLTRMFGVTVKTLITWEKAAGVIVTPTHIQYAGADPDVQLPDHTYPYARANGEMGIAYQHTNVYSAGVPVIRHNHAGQKSKAKAARNRVIENLQSADECSGGLSQPTRSYFENEQPAKAWKTARKHARKHFTPGMVLYVKLGNKNTRDGSLMMFERYDLHTDIQWTEVDDRDLKGELSSPAFENLRDGFLDSHFIRKQPQIWLKQCWKLSTYTEVVDTCTHTYSLIASDPYFAFAAAELGAQITLKTRKKTPRQSPALGDASATTEAQAEGVSQLLAFVPNAGTGTAYRAALLNKLDLLRHTRTPKITLNRLKSALDAAGIDMTKLEPIWTEIRQIKNNREVWINR